jgi:hypothetical protein
MAVPTVNCTSDTLITVYYNATGKSQPAADAAYGSEAVWDSNFLAVHHFQASAAPELDSTSNDNDIASDSGTPVHNSDGPLGYGVEVQSAGSDYIYDATWAATGEPLTIEIFANCDTLPAGSGRYAWASIADYSDANDYFYVSMLHDGATEVNTYASSKGASGAAADTEDVTNFSALTWYHIAGTFASDTDRTAWSDGLPGPGDSTDIGSQTGIDTLSVGARRYNSTAGYYADGHFDELRISDGTPRTVHWLKATRNVVIDHSTYMVEGSPGST